MARVPFDPSTDYYQILGVPPGADSEEIQSAYRRLAKEYHPDLHADSAVAAARMARVNVAKSVLLDRDTRASYDQLRAGRRRAVSHLTTDREPSQPTVRYAPQPVGARPRYRVVSHRATRSAARGTFDRQTGILFLVAVPLMAALVLYVFEAVQLSVQPPKLPPTDLTLSPNGSRPTARGAAEAAFIMVHSQPPSRDLAMRTNNFILQRTDSSPESELLKADGLRLLRAARSGDTAEWEAAVDDMCHLASRC
jgi:curved DNA-binding protein CbpA